MGEVKDQMKPTAPAAKDSILGKITRKRTRDDAPAQTFTDFIQRADEQLTRLVTLKESELASEKGREAYNRQALGLLRTMAFHLDAVIEHAADYAELK